MSIYGARVVSEQTAIISLNSIAETRRVLFEVRTGLSFELSGFHDDRLSGGA